AGVGWGAGGGGVLRGELGSEGRAGGAVEGGRVVARLGVAQAASVGLDLPLQVAREQVRDREGVRPARAFVRVAHTSASRHTVSCGVYQRTPRGARLAPPGEPFPGRVVTARPRPHDVGPGFRLVPRGCARPGFRRLPRGRAPTPGTSDPGGHEPGADNPGPYFPSGLPSLPTAPAATSTIRAGWRCFFAAACTSSGVTA